MAVSQDAGDVEPENHLVSIHYPNGLLGLVGPDREGFHYSLSRGDDIYTAGWAPGGEDVAKRIVETLAPIFATGTP